MNVNQQEIDDLRAENKALRKLDNDMARESMRVKARLVALERVAEKATELAAVRPGRTSDTMIVLEAYDALVKALAELDKVAG